MPAARIEGQSLDEVFGSHPVYRAERSLRKAQILDAFSDFVDEDSFRDWHLSLWRFATTRPLTYIRHETIRAALEFLSEHPELTIAAIAALQNELSHAIFSMLRPGPSWAKEDSLSLDRPDEIAEFESVWHPEYQRYCEHAFNHLAQVPLYVLGSLRGKNYLAPALAQRVDLLRKNGLATLAAGYDSVVRNAIAHGNTDFEISGVRYVDSADERLLAPWEFAELLDNLVDACHSILVALLLFVCRNQTLVQEAGLHRLPLGLRFIFIDAFASHPAFEVLSMIESSGVHANSQLNLVCRIGTKARGAQLLEGMHTCWNACLFGGEKYTRFFVSFDCGMPVLSTLALNGTELRRAVERNETLGECAPRLIEAQLLWYDAPSLKGRAYAWRSLLPVQWATVRRQIVRSWRDRGLKVYWSRYSILKTTNTSNTVARRVEAHIALHDKEAPTDELLRGVVRDAMRRLRRRRVRLVDLHGEKGCARMPDYVAIRLYSCERRVRTLKSYGLKDKELLLIAEWTSLLRKVGPFYTQQADVVLGRMRIRYNPALAQSLTPRNTP